MLAYRISNGFWTNNYVKMTSFWRYNDVINTSCVQWVDSSSGWKEHEMKNINRIVWVYVTHMLR